MSEDFSTIVEKIVMLQGERSTSQFARDLGLQQSTLDLYLTGKRKPSVELIVAVCSKCGRSADWLLGLSSPGDSAQADWRERAIAAEKKMERVNRALGHALKGFEELQEAVK